jgi:hypothetical protein
MAGLDTGGMEKHPLPGEQPNAVTAMRNWQRPRRSLADRAEGTEIRGLAFGYLKVSIPPDTLASRLPSPRSPGGAVFSGARRKIAPTEPG